MRCLDTNDRLDQLAAEKLAFQESAAEQVRYSSSSQRRTTSRVLLLAGNAAAVQDEVGIIKAAISEREKAQRLALLEEINVVQTAAHAWETIGLCEQFVKGWALLRFNKCLLFS